jgi:uncharacterized membrane protein (DUF373 family)
MKKSTPVFVEIIINTVISLILYNIAAATIFAEENPFNSSVQGFLVVFVLISLFDMIWKLIRNRISRGRKK